MKSIGEAIQYLHSINIAHRDVKVPRCALTRGAEPCLAAVLPGLLPALPLTSCPLSFHSRKTSCTPPKGPMLC